MRNFLSVLSVCALAISVNFSAMATPMNVKGDGTGNPSDKATPSSDGGDVFAITIEALKDLDKLKDDGAAEAVGNTLGVATATGIIQTQYEQCVAAHGKSSYCEALRKQALLNAGMKDEADKSSKMTPEEIRREREKKAAQEYAECLKSNTQETCQNRLQQAYDEAKADYFRAEPEKAKEELSQEYEKCLSESTGGSAADIAAYCKMKHQEALLDAGLVEDATEIELSPGDKKIAKEVQAEQDYEKCMKETKSETECSRKLDEAYNEAKKDYYREDPDLAKKDVAYEYEKCTEENPGPRGAAYCRAEADKTLREVNIEDDTYQNSPEERRAAKEIQAQKDEEKCEKETGSTAQCSQKFHQAYNDAKMEYYRAEPAKAKEEIDADYLRCRSQMGGNSAQGIASCNQARSSTLQQVGLPVTTPPNPNNLNLHKDDPNDVSNKYNSDSTGHEESPNGNEPDWSGTHQDDEDDPESDAQ